MPQRSSTSDTPKLRDSCEHCASAKVRCSKEKPTCLRCRDRGLSCEYGTSRRNGRAAQNPFRKSKDHRSSSDRSSVPSEFMGAMHANEWATLDPMDVSPLSIGEQVLPVMGSDSFFPVQEYDMGHMSHWSSTTDLTSWSGSDSGLPGSRDQSCSFNSRNSSFAPKHSCLDESLDLLRQLCIHEAVNACARRSESGLPLSPIASLQAGAENSRRTLDAVDNILRCPCSLNGNVLTLLFLVTLKLIGCYAASVHSARQAQSPPAVPVDDRASAASFALKGMLRDLPPGFDQMWSSRPMSPSGAHAQMAAQEVLNDLYRIQETGNRISLRVEEARQSAADVAYSSPHSPGEFPEFLSAISNVPSLLSREAAAQFAEDLRQRLRAVSFVVIQMLV